MIQLNLFSENSQRELRWRDSLQKGKQKTSKSSKWGTRFFGINEASEVIKITLIMKKNDFSFTVLNTSFWHDFSAIWSIV